MRFVSGVSAGGSSRAIFGFKENVLQCGLHFTGAVELLGHGLSGTNADGVNFADNDEITFDFTKGGDGIPPGNFFASGAGAVEWWAVIR